VILLPVLDHFLLWEQPSLMQTIQITLFVFTISSLSLVVEMPTEFRPIVTVEML
jgi:hypothetical protein